MTDLTEDIQHGWAAADADAPDPAVAYFRDLLARHPRNQHALASATTLLTWSAGWRCCQPKSMPRRLL
jgi:hypothetical protein